MSARGRGSRGGYGNHGPAPDGPPQFLWSLLVIGAALIGGLAAATLAHTSLTIAVVVSVIAGVIAVFAVVRWPGPHAELPPPRPPLPDPGQARPPGPQPPEARPPGPAFPRDDRRAETLIQAIPLPSPQRENSPLQAAGTPWWEAGNNAAPPRPSPAGQRAPAPDLSSYLASALIAQCPRCGAFGLDIRHFRSGWAFRCESCEYTWTWQPGTPWPPVRVMPRRRKEPGPPSP
jgi:hypothetical protein